jgi:hypothetical protein
VFSTEYDTVPRYTENLGFIGPVRRRLCTPEAHRIFSESSAAGSGYRHVIKLDLS